MIDDLLAEVTANGGTLGEPASEDDVTRVATWFRRQSGRALPNVYRDLLARADGVEINGTVLYASADGDGDIAGMPESNDRLDADDSGNTYIGEDGDNLFAVTSGGAWVVLDGVSGETWESFETCELLLDHVLREAVDG